MAECRVKKTLKYILVLNDEEAAFVKNLCQNDLSGMETDRIKDIRIGIFNSLLSNSEEDEVPF